MNAKDRELIETIRFAIREALAELAQGAYLDAESSSRYLGVCLRSFESGPAKEVPSHRLTPRGKRLYRRDDLDRYMVERRRMPANDYQVTRLVDDVVSSIRSGK